MVPHALASLDGVVPITTNTDVVACRQTVRRLADQLRFTPVAQTMLVTAASELARNTLIHGDGGQMVWQLVNMAGKRGLRLIFEDEGPGIADIGIAMTNGWTSKNGLGLGLPGAKRLVNEFHIESTPGVGTRVTITHWVADASRASRRH